jgi:rhodanese-related sulfurtransferase
VKKGTKELVAEASAQVRTVTLDQAFAMLDEPDVVFVDLREAEELLEYGKIPGAEHHPRGLLEFYADPEHKFHRPVFASGKLLVLYCGSGGRSALATKALQDMGLHHVAQIEGGIKAWIAAGLPIDRTAK